MMTHAAVDDEVERITERDEHVDEESRHLARLGADQIDVHRVLNDEHYITSNHSYRDSKRPVLSAVFKKRFLSLRDSRHVLSVYVQESSPFFPRFQTCSFNCFRKTFLFLERFETTSSLTKNVPFPCEISDIFFQWHPRNFSIPSDFPNMFFQLCSRNLSIPSKVPNVFFQLSSRNVFIP